MSQAVIPAAGTLTASPLRHRIRLDLNAPPREVWALVGDHARLPEYSAGIARVETTEPDSAAPGRLCYFHPMEGATEGLVVREVGRWYAPGIGYATSSEPGNPFGLKDDLSLITLEPTAAGTRFVWEQYYDADDLEAIRASFDEGLADIAERLVARFGGAVLERYSDRQ
jgi:uncharacterized protein YndB with AHSA1/START domain